MRWAAQALAGAGRATLVDAGGDLQAGGPGPDGEGWLVAVEDPRGGTEPVAVLRLVGQGCATSSVRLRHWSVGGRRCTTWSTRAPGSRPTADCSPVTVVGPDVARAEVWSKALFVAGRGNVRRIADERGIAALLVDTDGGIGVSRAMRPH